MTLNTIDSKTINITESAAKAVFGIFSEKELDPNTHYLRVYIAGQGCSGFQYGLGIETEKNENDLVFEDHGVKVLIDDTSILSMSGSSIDFVEMDGQSGFKVDNPNATSGCGCGDGAEKSSNSCAC